MADPIVAELVEIKKLLVYALLENGVSQEGVAKALGKDQSYVSRMFGKGGATKRVTGGRQKGGTNGTEKVEADDAQQ